MALRGKKDKDKEAEAAKQDSVESEATETQETTGAPEAGAKTQETAGTTPEAEVETAAEVEASAKETPALAGAEKTLPVQRAGTAVAKTTNKFVPAYTDFENALPPVEFGILPRLKASSGKIKDGDGENLGEQVIIKLVSFNRQFVMAPNDNDAPNDAVGYSYDGETETNTGMPVAEFMAKLKENYEKASIKEYYEVVGLLEEAEKETEHLDGMVQLQLSPQSRKDFESFRLQQSVKESMGKVDLKDARILVTAQEKTFGSNEYTKLHFSAAS